MVGVFFTPGAIFFEGELFGGIEFIACSHVVLPFADSTDECQCDALFFFGHSIKKFRA